MFFYIIGAILLCPISYSTVNSNVPSIISPYSFTVVLPTLLLSEFFDSKLSLICSAIFISVLFFYWSTPLVNGQKSIPTKTKVASLFFIVLSIIHLGFSWEYGKFYQGISHTLMMYFYNIIFWIILLLLFIINKKSKNYISNFLYHWIFFAWLGWVSFPWLGELI